MESETGRTFVLVTEAFRYVEHTLQVLNAEASLISTFAGSSGSPSSGGVCAGVPGAHTR